MDQPDRLFTIQQLSLKLEIPKSTLRFWEKELEGILIPLRTRGGQRRYAAEHISIIKEIKHMSSRGLSLAEIKRTFVAKTKDDRQETDKKNKQKIDILADRIAETVKTEVYNLLKEELD